MTKDATIREIHHRVKNNLQTVAALLRMQARRIDFARGEGRAQRRHVPGRLDRDRARDPVPGLRRDRRVRPGRRRPAADGGRRRGLRGGVSAVRQGSFGLVSADVATSLAMIVTELCQNAVEHGLADRSGEVRVVPTPSTAGCGSRSATTAAACRRTSTGAPRAASACPSWTPWSRRWRAPSSSARNPRARARARSWKSRSDHACSR